MFIFYTLYNIYFLLFEEQLFLEKNLSLASAAAHSIFGGPMLWLLIL
jgi:hypothetical protein